MKLTERQSRIVNILFKNRQSFITSQEIANKLGVTNKTVQSDIFAIADFLNNNNIHVRTERGKGYKLEFDQDHETVDIINSFIEINEVDETDIQTAWIICYFIINDGYVTQRDIMDTLLISLGQFKVIFPQLVQELSRHKLSITSVPGYGFAFEGEEINKRIAFIHFYRILGYSGYFKSLFDETCHFTLELGKKISSQQLIQHVEKHNFRIDDNNVNQLLNYLLFSIFRINKGHCIEHLQVAYVVERELLNLAHDIAFDNILGHEEEIVHLAAFIRLVVLESSLVNIIQMNSKDAKIIQNINKYLLRRRTLFINAIENIDEFQREITNAIILIVCKNSVGFRDAVSGYSNFDIDDEFIVAIEYAVLLTFKLEAELNIEFYRDDIFRLAMIFNVHFRQNVWDVNKRVIITSNGSRIQQRYLARKILSEIPSVDVDIVFNIESTDLTKMNPLPIVITDNLVCMVDRRIRVGNFKSLVQYAEIIDYIKSIDTDFDISKKRFLNLFDEERFTMLNVDRRNDVVAWICQKYGCSNERTATIQFNVFIRESRYYPTVYHRIAFPRIYVDNIDYPRIEVIKLEKEILWNNTPIDMVIAYILPNTYNSLTVLGMPFIEIASNISLLNELIKSQSYDNFYLCLSKKTM